MTDKLKIKKISSLLLRDARIVQFTNDNSIKVTLWLAEIFKGYKYNFTLKLNSQNNTEKQSEKAMYNSELLVYFPDFMEPQVYINAGDYIGFYEEDGKKHIFNCSENYFDSLYKNFSADIDDAKKTKQVKAVPVYRLTVYDGLDHPWMSYDNFASYEQAEDLGNKILNNLNVVSGIMKSRDDGYFSIDYRYCIPDSNSNHSK